MLLSLRVEKGPARLGVVASRKVGPAVARNRAKRLVREAFRRNPTVFPEGLDVVIVVRPGIHRLTQGDVDEQVRKARPLLSLRAAELHKERPRAGSPSALEEAPGDPPDPTRDRLRRR
jgi:ribonuclease P protein component